MREAAKRSPPCGHVSPAGAKPDVPAGRVTILFLAASLLASRTALSERRAGGPPRVGRPTVAIEIGDEEVRYGVTLPMGLFDALVKIGRREADFIDREERERARAALEKLLKEKNPVTIDGIRVGPVLKELEFIRAEAPGPPARELAPAEPLTNDAAPAWLPKEVVDAELAAAGAGTSSGTRRPGTNDGRDRPSRASGSFNRPNDDRIGIAGGYVSIVLSYGTKGRPRQVSVVWRLFPDPAEAALDEVRAGLVAYDDFREIRFTREEPEFIWHALEAPTRRGLLRVRREKPARSVSVPVVSLSLLAGLVVALVLLRRFKVNARVALGVSAITIAAAVGTVGVGRSEVRLRRPPRFRRPNEPDAKEIFQTLHRNIYRAFDYKSEDDIYDALARSVDGELLDEIYNEVYQSLVLRDQGGAVCRIQSVKVLDMRIEGLEGPGGSGGVGFDVRNHWLVNGAVSHWGHTHFRTNEYRAVYTVEPRPLVRPGRSPTYRPREGAWKITAARVLEYRRLTDDDPAGKASSGTRSGKRSRR